ncbi:MAG TPA: GntR family transcriptional regulator [Actinomycetota bacterium]|nr:GntR family transcriptional regulator [Actinomycetota bacterium]
MAARTGYVSYIVSEVKRLAPDVGGAVIERKPLEPSTSWAHAVAGEGRRTAHEFVKDSLRRAILRGDLSGGARLIQADLAATLNVSTTPVREALRDLATEGLITLDRHRGGVVRELNWREMDEIRLIRQQLEPLAVRLVVERISDEELDEAERLAQRMSKERDLGNWVELTTQVHLVVHRSTGMARLTAILKGFEEASAVYVAQAQRWHPEIRRRANDEHRALIDAFRSRGEERAAEVMRGHAAMPIEMTRPEERGAD